MVRYIIKKIILNRHVAPLLLPYILNLHNFCYSFSSALARISNNNIHPKHKILEYKEWFQRHINVDDVVLDVGSNTGALPFALANKAIYVYGIEIVENLVAGAILNNRFKNVSIICGDATTYNYDALKPITVVTMSNVLEHIEHRVKFLTKIINQVKWKDESNKRLLIRVPMLDRDWISVYKKNIGVEWRLDKTHFTEYTMKSFENEIAASGVELLDVEVKFGEVYAVCKAI